MKEKVDMRKTAIESIDTLIGEGSKIDSIEFERDWIEIYNPDQPWIAKREASGYAKIIIKFAPVGKKENPKTKTPMNKGQITGT
ncbi:unnamed protein product [marine sediment metagenome]|uniref:Uncharacterized protein n=1 Tax=marine sediment metagenome TaxID=412755 RepID=X0VYG5_9ZZZZ